MKNKLFACLLSVVLCFAICGNALAVGISVSPDDTILKRGDTLTVDVTLTETLNVKSGGVYVEYDSDVLSVESYKWHFATNPMIQHFDTSTGVGVFAYMSPANVSDLVFTVTFKVVDDAAYVDSAVNIKMSFKDNVDPKNDIETDSVAVNFKVICEVHTPGTDATCTEDQTCTACKSVLTPAKGHSESETWSIDGECHMKKCAATGCDYLFEDSVAEHSSTGSNVATCTNKAVCDVCGAEYGDLSADNHVNTEIRGAVEATATTEGYTGDTYCKDCDKKLADGTVIPMGGFPGDVNGDGYVNLSDASLILKHIAKWDITMDTVAADVNDDEFINLSDVSLILKYIAKWDVTLK